MRRTLRGIDPPVATQRFLMDASALSRRRTLVWLTLPAWALAAGPALAWRTTGSGQAGTETRSPGAFEGVASRGSIDISVRQGPVHEVVVQADDNLLELLETVVEAQRGRPVLQVRWRDGSSVRPRSPVRVTVQTPTLSLLAGAGSGDFHVAALRTPSLSVSLSGSGDVHLEDLDTAELTVSVAGSGDVTGAGKAGRLSVSVAGSGDVQLLRLQAQDVSVRVAGSGDVKVHAARTLEVGIAGSGDVTHAGEAAVNARVAGSGRVRRP
jgi:hypothetical protein